MPYRKDVKSAFVLALLAAASTHAESGYNAWLRYAPVTTPMSLPAVVVSAHDSTARAELIRGVRGMLGKTLRIDTRLPQENAVLLGTADEIRQLAPSLTLPTDMKPDSYLLRTVASGGLRFTVVAGGDERGVLYGAFALLRKIAMAQDVAKLDERHTPEASVRWMNQWDNLDGSIERGYGGRSIFWDNGHVRDDMTQVSDYGRLLASIGINATTIDNVNADKRLLSAEFIPQIARIAGALRPWGVRVAVSVDFGSPQSLGGLDTFDPLDAGVANWWKARADDLYRAVPDLAGFVLKADSEGRVGPVGVQANTCRRSERGGSGTDAAWRAAAVSGLRLRPSHGLEQPEERPGARCVR